MSSNREQPTRQRAFGRAYLPGERKAILPVILFAAVFLLIIPHAGASGIPSQIIVFTDKNVYSDFIMQQGRGSGGIPAYVALETDDLVIYSYAIVLDDDGNIMKGLTGINGTLDDTRRLDHYHKNDGTYHHNTTFNPDFYNNINLIYNDTGTSGDGITGDGVYTAYANIPDSNTAQANDLLDDHLVINISARYGSRTSYTEVLYSGVACHNGQAESHGTHTSSDVSPASNGPSPCTICHRGYEHFFENRSSDQNGSPTFLNSNLDVHFRKIQPNYTVRGGNQALTVIWNLSKTGGIAWGGKGAYWETNMPGSSYCYICHYAAAGGSLLDYGAGDRTNLAERPSCSVPGKSLNGVSEAIACHAATKIEGEATLNWTDPAAVSGAGTSLNATWKAKSHNQTNPPNKANVSCAVCHGAIHRFRLPNSSAAGADYLDINNQCILCHNISGGLNITANGGKNTNHTNANCKACHLNNNLKLDAHFMPAATYPSANCTECHDLGGRALYHIDFNIFNNSDYVHNQYNATKGLHPLNFNASNGSALRPSDNKICWGCHGDDPNNDGKADYSEQPVNDHPKKYRNARRCEECHQNGSAPWDAPQNVAHSFNTIDVRTPGAPNCYDCHGQPVMFNNSHKDADVNESNEKGVKASAANHYGTGFPPLAKSRGSNGYCIKYCHQNSSSPFLLEFYNKDNMQRPNHSAMTTRPQNQSCRDKECHAADAIHDEKMRKPTLSGGTFGNGNCTAQGCHSPSDSGNFNYSYHNSAVNCTSCHMDNIGSNIHPIKYLQNDGIDFAQVSLTAATCKLCHKNSQANDTLSRWGVTPRKIGSQHHSGDPENGSKWNGTEEPYWDYVPNQITFVSGWVKSSYRGFIANFDAMKDTNYSAARISENVTEDSFVGHYPSNNDFNGTVQAGNWYSNGTATTKSWSDLPADGNPNGSLIVASTTRSQVVDATWTSTFRYDKTGRVADATIKLDSKLVKGKSIDTAMLKAINVTIDDHYGNITEVFNRSLPDVPEVDWSVDERTIPNPESVFWKNGTLDHTYNVTIRTRWTNINGVRSPDIKVAYDNVFVNVSEADYKKYNIIFHINNTPPSDRYDLVVGYQTHIEPARLYVLNGSIFEYRANLDSGAFTKIIIPLSQEDYGNGNITLRINDSNGPGESQQDVSEIDVKPDYIDIEYMFIDSYKWINNSRVNYPCEYCHAPNKHFQHALGIPESFKGNNYVGQRVNSSTTWCASCHYQGYSSSSKNYTDMIKSFLDHMLPVPPEITGHSLYGVNKTQSPDYYEHSGLGSFDDSICWSCHSGSLEEASTSTVFMHNVTAGKSGGSNCTYCHEISSSGAYPKVDFTAINASVHGNLNNKAVSTEQNKTNKPCWACHGTQVGAYANESDQPSIDHDQSYYRNPRPCVDCHINGTVRFNAKGLTQHIMPEKNASTQVKVTEGYCSVCHNNSITPNADIDGMGISGVTNASAAHYAKDANNNLMTSNIHSDNCTYCHFFRNGSNEWLTPRKPVTSSHSSLSNDTPPATCWGCHMDSPGEPSTFHGVEINRGKSSGPDCRSCHNISDTDVNRGHIDTGAFNNSIHREMNTGADDNEPCWGCHGNGNSEGHNMTGDLYGKGSYKNPYNCTDCHVPGGIRYAWASSRNALTVAEHFTGGSDIKASYDGKVVFSCLACHENLSEMHLPNSDNDINRTAWASGGDTFAAIGGNKSPYHYGRKRQDLRSGINASCEYCHQNLSSVFPLTFTNMSIREHTSAGTNVTSGVCTDSYCHSTGFIHNSTLTKPQVKAWTAGRNDYCSPCHNVNDPYSTAYIFAHNTSEIAIVSMDCGYCHNASSQGQLSSQALKVHTGTLTNTSIRNSSCTSCHRDSLYVGSERVINTHYPGATSGKANTSRSGWDCQVCHGLSPGAKMHSQGLIRKPDYDCNACHSATGASPNKAYAIPFVNLTRHDNTSHNGANINCSSCHNSTGRMELFHFTLWPNGTVEAPGWAGWTNGTRANCIDCHVTYANAAPFYAEPSSWHKKPYGAALDACYQCHSNLTVLNAGDSRSPVEMHNVTRSIDWNNCNACHSYNYGGANRVDNTSLESGMHARIDGASTGNIDPACRACHGGNSSAHRNTSAHDCTYCHITGKTKYNAKNVSEHIPDGNYPNTSINTSRYKQVFCDLCHNNSISVFNDDTPGTGNATSAHYGQNRSAGKLMSISVNSSDCLYCHKNTSNMAKWGVNATQRANIINREDHSSISTNAECYDCHVETRGRPQTFHTDELLAGSGSSPNCLGCHNITSTFMKIDFSVTNHSSSIHKNLNSNANAMGYDGANRPCWACHGNGSATAHIDNTYKAPRLCENCHINISKPYGAPQVGEHYRNGSHIKAANAADNTRSCITCHQGITEMLLSNSDPDAGSFDADGDHINGTGISAYHYGKKRSDLRSGSNTSCIYCHQNSSTPFPLSESNRSIREHTEKGAGNTTGGSCTLSKCHSAGLIHDTNLSKNITTNWTQGAKDFCAPCHKPGNAGATRYVYNQKHDPANSSTDRIGDCGFCHNASSQGMNGGTLKIHDANLTNTTSPAVYGKCAGCHNGTAAYVGASKQMFSHLPGASSYRGNTSMSNYSCEQCHNLLTGSSMHSAGMDRSNGTCITCHFDLTSPFKATVKKIETWDYNHTYTGQKSCSIVQCHNASGAALGFHLDRYAGAVVADPERVNGVWSDRNAFANGFTDTPYIDCIDCHREHNNSYPFNNTYPFNYSTSYSFNYEANNTGNNKKIHTISDSMDSCYNCHTDKTDARDPGNRYKVHNVSIEPLLGGPACISCHNMSAPTTAGFPPITRKINHTAFNQSIHRKLVNYTFWNESKKQNSVPLDSACWKCHSSNMTDIPNNAHPDRGGPASVLPFQCNECHTPEGNMSVFDHEIHLRAPKIYQHYAGKSFIGDKIFNSSKGCPACHMNSQVATFNISYGGMYVRGNEANSSHYALREYLIKTNQTHFGCNQCHAIGDSGGLEGFDYGNAISVPDTHTTMGSTDVACQDSCHNANTSISITNHNMNMGIYLGESACYSAGCHSPPSCEECTR